MGRMLVGSLLVCVLISAPAYSAPAVVVAKKPSLACPQTELGDADLQVRYATMWERYSAAVDEASKKVRGEIEKQTKSATGAGNLDLALFWKTLGKEFEQKGELRWDEPSLKKTWGDRFSDASFPAEVSVAVKKASEAYKSAQQGLEKGYGELVAEFTKAEKLEEALKVRGEIKELLAEKAPAPEPAPASAKPKPEPKQPTTRVNLLAGLDVAQGRVAGSWQMRGGPSLVATGTKEIAPRFCFVNNDALELTKDDYDLTMQFSVTPDEKGFSDVIPYLPGVPAAPCFRNNAEGGSRIFLFGMEGNTFPKGFEPNRKYTAVLSVRKKGSLVRISIDGKEVLNSEGFAHQDRPTDFKFTVSPGAVLTLYQYSVSKP